MTESPFFRFAHPAYRFLITAASLLRSPLLLLIRVFWGWQFFMTGKGKLGDLHKVSDYFASLNIPLPTLNAIMAGCTETFGGLLLLLGLGSRLICLPLIVTMIVAYATAERESLNAIFSDPDKFIKADPFLFLYAALIVLAFGPGKFSIDYLLERWLRKRAVIADPSSPAR